MLTIRRGGDEQALCLADSPHATLLETMLRSVGEWELREVSEQPFYGQLHVGLETIEAMYVADLRNPALARLNIDRTAIASSSLGHYPCTRTEAKAIHASRQNLAASSSILVRLRSADGQALKHLSSSHTDWRTAVMLLHSHGH